MKSLLTAVQAALKAGLTDVRESDVFIAPFELYLPEAVKSPAIGIKDHGTRRRELVGGMVEVSRSIMVVPWVQVVSAENAILGSWASGQPGILDLSEAIQTLLDENLLGLTGCMEAFGESDSATEMTFTQTAPWQRQELVYTYQFEEERP